MYKYQGSQSYASHLPSIPIAYLNICASCSSDNCHPHTQCVVTGPVHINQAPQPLLQSMLCPE